MTSRIEQGHSWVATGTGLHCRANLHVTYDQLLLLRTEQCPVAGAPPTKGALMTRCLKQRWFRRWWQALFLAVVGMCLSCGKTTLLALVVAQ